MLEAAERGALSRRLPFTFRLVDGAGKLALKEQHFFGWLRVDRLELDVPGLQPPLDLGSGPEMFQRRRTRVQVASLCLDQRDLEQFVKSRGPTLAELGVEECEIRCRDGHLAVTARVREGPHVADLSFRIHLLAPRNRSLRVRVLIDGALAYGFLPVPAPLVAHRVLEALIPAGRSNEGHAQVCGLGDIEIAALDAFLWNALPPAGWRLPAVADLEIAGVQVRRGSLGIHYAQTAEIKNDDGSGAAELAAAQLAAVLERFHEADERLRSGDLDGALRGYRGALAAGGPDQSFVIERLLALTATRKDLFRDAADLARQTLRRSPGFAPAHVALAALAIARGALAEATDRLAILADFRAESGDDEETARAALAGARLQRELDPDKATTLYERALVHSPGHPEASDALGELYAAKERWDDLVRLLRARLVTLGDPAQRALEHLRLGEILAHQLHDLGAGRAELEKACELDPAGAAGHEALADLLFAQGADEQALVALEKAAQRHGKRGDRRSQARIQSRIAAALLGAGNGGAAQSYLRRALELEPKSPEALRGAASLAENQGQHRKAASLWRQIAELGGKTPAELAEVQVALGRCLLAAGDATAARPELLRAAQNGSAPVAARARALLAEQFRAENNLAAAASELAAAVSSLVGAAEGETEERARDLLLGEAARLALARGELLLHAGQEREAMRDMERAHSIGRRVQSDAANAAARALADAAARQGDRAGQRRWLDTLLETAAESAAVTLLLERAALRAADQEAQEALADVDRALDRATDDATRRDVLRHRASHLGVLGRWNERAEVLAQLSSWAGTDRERLEAEIEALHAWLQADEPAAAMEIGHRAARLLAENSTGETTASSPTLAAASARILAGLGEAAWRLRDWQEVGHAYKELLAAPDDGGQDRAQIAYRFGMSLQQRGHLSAALEMYERALGGQASGEIRARSWRALAELQLRLAQPAQAATSYRSLATDPIAEASAAERADAWCRAAEIHRHHGGGAEEAQGCLEEALRLVENYLPALDALEHIKREQGDFERVAVILGRKIAATAKHPKRQKPLLLRLAALERDHLDRLDVARETFARVLELDPDDRTALTFAAEDALRAGDSETAIELYQRLAGELAGDGAAVGEFAEIARQRRAALATLAQLHRLKADWSGLQAVLERRARLAEEAGDGKEAARIASERDAAAARVAEAAKGGGDDARVDPDGAAAAAMAAEAELLASSIGSRARSLVKRGQPIDEELAAMLSRLRELSQKTRNFEPLASALEAAAAATQDRSAASTLLRQAAALLGGPLADAEGAAVQLGRALALAPGDPGTMEELDAVLREIGDFARLVSAYELHLQAILGPSRARPLVQLGRIYRDQQEFHNPQRAADCFAEAFEADPTFVDAWLPLANIWYERGQLRQARNLYHRILEELDLSEEDRSELVFFMAELDQALAQSPDADVAGEIEVADGIDPGQVEEAVRAAEALESSGQLEAAVARYQEARMLDGDDRRPLVALQRLYSALGDCDGLVDVLAKLAEIASDPRERAALLLGQAKVHRDLLHQEAETYRCLREAHRSDPDDPEIAHALRAVAMARGEWAVAAELIYREINASDDARERGALHLELAMIHDEKLLDADEALRHYEQALTLDSEIPAAPKPLARLYELRGRYAEAMGMNQLAAERSREEGERGRLLIRAAMNAERAGLTDKAQELYGAAAKMARTRGDKEDASRGAARLSSRSPAKIPSFAPWEERLRAAKDPGERADFLRQMLEIATTHRDGAAIQRYGRALLDLEPTEQAAWAAIKAMATADRDWTTVADLIRSRASVVTNPEEVAALYCELGQLYRREVGELDLAIEAYERGLAADPKCVPALEARAELAYETRDWQGADDLYLQIEPERSSLSADELAYRRGEVAEALGRETEAMNRYAEAVKCGPSNRLALAALARVAMRLGEITTAIEASRNLIELLPPHELRAITETRLQLAEMCRQSGDASRAIEYYELVLAEDPKSLPALQALADLYSDRGDYSATARVLGTLSTMAKTPEKRAQLLFQQAEIFRQHLRDEDAAADAYLKASDLAPNHVPTLRRLIDYYWRAGDAKQLMVVAADLGAQNALLSSERQPLARVMAAAAVVGQLELAHEIADQLGGETTDRLTETLLDAEGRGDLGLLDGLVRGTAELCRRVPSLALGELHGRVAARSPNGELSRRLAAARRAVPR